jgi:DNA-binding transcriptional LysR family regulator
MDIRTLDYNLLVVFEAILREKSVTAAADALGLTQPAVSAALTRFRNFVGDPLFIRTNRGMVPTPHAVALSGPLLKALEEIRESLLGYAPFDPDTSDRTLNLLLSDVGEVVFLPRLLQHLQRSAANIRVAVQQLPIADHADAFESGAVDLAIGYFPHLKTQFHQQPLYSDTFACMLRADHPSIVRRLTLRQFTATPHVVVSRQGINGMVLDKVLGQRGIAIKTGISVPHFVAIPPIVASTDMIAITPSNFASVYVDTGRLRQLPLPFPSPKIEIRQYWHRRYTHNPAILWLRTIVEELFHRD